MKRLRRILRWVAALLLVGLAFVVFRAYRPGPLWRVGFDMSNRYELVLGVDEGRGIVYTYYREFENITPGEPLRDKHEIRGYGLRSGNRLLTFAVPEPEPNGDGNKFVDHTFWEIVVAQGGQYVVMFPYGKAVLYLYRLPLLQCVGVFKLKAADGRSYPQITFSRDGRRLLARTDTHLILIDIASKKVVREIAIPRMRLEGRDHHFGSLQLSGDQRYAAMPGANGQIAYISVVDLETGGEIGACLEVLVPVFVDDRTIVGLQWRADQGRVKAKWFRIEEGGVREVSRPATPDITGELLCVKDGVLVTGEFLSLLENHLPSWVNWVPWSWLSDENQMRFIAWVGWFDQRIRLTQWDLRTGQAIEPRLEIGIPMFSSFGSHRCHLLRDLLVLNDGGEITVRSLRPGRPWWCWAACGVMVLLALWSVLAKSRRGVTGKHLDSADTPVTNAPASLD